MAAETPARPRRVRADAERSSTRILEAAESVLATDATASLEQIAQAAGLSRITVHRHFSSRQALLDALSERFNQRYLTALKQARVATAPPLIALHRLTELVFGLTLAHRSTLALMADPMSGCLAVAPEVTEGLDLLFTRLHAAGLITAASPSWGTRLYLALLAEVERLPTGSPELAAASGAVADPATDPATEPATDPVAEDVGARTDLLTRTVLGALGGNQDALRTP